MSLYWEIRQKILDALEAGDDKTLRELAELYPDEFQAIFKFAKNQLKNRRIS